MSIRIWSLVVCASLPVWALAQPLQFVSSARSADTAGRTQTTAVANASATAEISLSDRRVLPLFGELPKTTAQLGEEIQFLMDCDQNFASRTEASDFFAARGWDYLNGGQLDTAAHRFNLAWLLNDHNSEAFWGLGVICYQQNKLPDAVRVMRKGLAVADTNTVLMTDLATVQIKQFQLTQEQTYLTEADTLLQRANVLNPKNPTTLLKLSLAKFSRADYAGAWEFFHQARSIDIGSIDIIYLGELQAKMPDPTGFFK
jgi:tetratricopeptide (TPR) repeat protein